MGLTKTATLAVVTLLGLTGCPLTARKVAEHPSPDGGAIVVVREAAQMVDPIYPLELRQGWRKRSLGCVNGDYSSIRSVKWLDNDTIRFELGNGGDGAEPVTVRVKTFSVDETPRENLLHSC